MSTALVLLPSLSSCNGCESNAPSLPLPSTRAPVVDATPPPWAPPSDLALIPSAAGATLVWAAVTERGQELRTMDFDRTGARRAEATTLVSAERPGVTVSDVQALWANNGLTAAWLSRDDADGGHETKASAWLGVPGQHGESFDLGPAWSSAPDRSGNLALAARREGTVALVRGPDEPCPGEPGQPCHDFTFHTLSEGVTPEAGRVTLSVPVPCESNAARLLTLGQRWHYAICTRHEGRSVTTVFSITPSPEYAEAERLLPGCDPVGLTHRRGLPYLVADCPTGRAAIRVGSGADSDVFDLGEPRLRCAQGRFEIDAGALSLVLQEPRAELQTLIPTDGAQLVWTGQRVLEARRQREGIELGVRQCVRDTERVQRLIIPPGNNKPGQQNFTSE